MSIAGGRHKAVERAAALGCDCVQLFTGSPRSFPSAPMQLQLGKSLTKNNKQRGGAAIDEDTAKRFQQALAECGVAHPLAHSSYLINLASPDRELWQKSLDAYVEELRRATILGIPYVVIHPGSYTQSTLRQGIRRIVRALNRIHTETRSIAAACLLETTAGQGTSIGSDFDHFAMILEGVREPERLGVCFDTCHAFAAGYSFATPEEYEAMMAKVDATIGLGKIKAFHLNDSGRELGSGVDRHAHIGRGRMGLAPFRLVLRDRRFRDVPMYLETPKGEENGQDFDAINLQTLRALAGE